jgi:hypothetical protein
VWDASSALAFSFAERNDGGQRGDPLLVAISHLGDDVGIFHGKVPLLEGISHKVKETPTIVVLDEPPSLPPNGLEVSPRGVFGIGIAPKKCFVRVASFLATL